MGQRQIILSFRKPGTLPPVFVAGTFSKPEWQPHEMSYSATESGDYMFEKDVSVDAGTDVQYKFRLGTGDWWVCDENASKTSDASGNTNNVLRISTLSVDEGDFEDEEDDASDDAGPLFSHECFGSHDVSPTTSYSPGEDSYGNTTEPVFRFPNSSKNIWKSDKEDEAIDLNDPRLERFPHENRRSIIAELQRIETNTEPDRSLPEGIPPPSPIVSPTSSAFPTLLEPEPSPRRTSAPRAALGSFHSERSHISLASIDETVEEEADGVKGIESKSHRDHPRPGTFEAADYTGLGGSQKSTTTVAHQIEPSTPIVRLEVPSDEEDEGISLNTGSSTKNAESDQLRKRTAPRLPERPKSPTSTHSTHDVSKREHWLRSVFRVLFVSVGHFITNILFGNRRKA